jgi:hypothetical protein
VAVQSAIAWKRGSAWQIPYDLHSNTEMLMLTVIRSKR